MMGWMIASAILAAAWQNAAANGARQQLRTCIKEATENAKKQKLAAAGFATFARQHCAAQEASFKSAVWAFDSKNKVSRKQSEADAKLQIEDFVSMASERYQMETAPR
jgi:hypothetical protein